MAVFFASLALVTDENSFRKGLGILQKFPGDLKSVAVGAMGVAAGMVALATTTANAMTKLDAQARTLGMTARTLDNWRGAISLAGGDADEFVSSLMSMNEAFRNLKIGEVKTEFIQATGMSGANFAAMQNMGNDERVRAIWSALDRVTDAQKQQALREKIFGQGGVQLASLMQAKGVSLFQLYNQASSLNPLSDKDYKAAVEGDRQQREISQSLEKQFQNLGLKIEQALLPALSKLSDWFVVHQKDFDNFAEAVGRAASGVIDWLGAMSGDKGAGDRLSQGWNRSLLSGLLGGDAFQKAFEELGKMKGVDVMDRNSNSMGLMMGPEWAKVADAVRKQQVGTSPEASILATFQGKGVSSASQKAFQQFAQALNASGASFASRVLQEDAVARGVGFKPNINMVLQYDASGNARLFDKDTGKTMAEVKKGIGTANTTSGLQ